MRKSRFSEEQIIGMLHVCTQSAASWLQLGDSLPRYSEKPPGMSPTVGYDPTTGEVS